MKAWTAKARKLLDQSLDKIPQELNELDWKDDLSPKNEKLCKHISAFANHPGGGYLVFGIDDKTAEVNGIDPDKAKTSSNDSPACVEILSNHL
ncbi:MAG: ATP-binding protein [Saprospiraceae bacterium]|nr:ATP-binding protein [Saprospiraceae bacterium]